MRRFRTYLSDQSRLFTGFRTSMLENSINFWHSDCFVGNKWIFALFTADRSSALLTGARYLRANTRRNRSHLSPSPLVLRLTLKYGTTTTPLSYGITFVQWRIDFVIRYLEYSLEIVRKEILIDFVYFWLMYFLRSRATKINQRWLV